ncbi:Ig-like domain-containing protein [Cellulomonas hominis]
MRVPRLAPGVRDLLRRPRVTRRRATSAAAVVTVPAVLAVLAIVNPGFPLARVDLNDGAVWLTSTSTLQLGRYNAQVEELNAGLVTTGGRFDVLQDAGDVLLVEPASVSVVDPATVTLTTQVALTAGARVAMAAGTVAITDADGQVWIRPLAGLDGLRVGADPADLDLGEGGAAVVTDDGAVLGVEAGTGDVTRVTLGADGSPTRESIGSLGGGVDQLAAVGDEPVGLDGQTLRTLGGTSEVPGADPTLQETGAASDRVLVATRTALVEADLGSAEVVAEHVTRGSGRAAAPVRVAGCAHAAWASATGSYLRLCDGKDAEVLDLEGMSASDELTFRVNRSVVVLNDTVRGRVWLPLEDTDLREPSWADIVPEEDPQEDAEEAEGDQTTQQLVSECSDASAPPTAADDEFGVRAGRSVLLPVIDNDSTSDCGILAISEFDPVPAEFGQLEAVYGGRSLQLTVADGASGSVSFTYTISDGRGTQAPSTATVTVSVRDAATNAAPVQSRVGTMLVEQGAQTTYPALADFTDPDGDDLVLVAATAEQGVVRFRQDGSVTFVAQGTTLGRTQVRLVVSDGVETVEGTVAVDVRAAGSLPPQIDPVHAVTYVDQPVLLQPLTAVRSSSDEPARLAEVTDVAGATIATDLDAGTFTFAAARPGTYYVEFTVTVPPQQASGLARIDVREWPSEVAPPVAVRDTAYLPAGGTVTVDPLANDTDPAGGVLVLQSVAAPADSGLQVAVVGHQLVELSADRTLTGPVLLTYEVSNGSASARGEIVVHPVPAATSSQPPVVENVEVDVRTGGVVTIPVLDSAYDPDGDAISLVRELAEPLADGDGLLFVSGDVLRYQAPDRTLTARATFVVRDATGNETAATLTVRVHESDASTKAPARPVDLTARVFQGDTVRISVPLVGIDADGDGVTLLGVATAPTKGRITDSGADWLEYQALPGESGTDTFTYAVEDWAGQRAVATVRVGIAPRPADATQVVARDDSVTVRPGQTVEVRVLANDVDASGSELTLSDQLELQPGTIARVEGRRVVVQAPDQPTVLQIVYTVTNGRGGRDTAVLTVLVDGTAVPQAPLAQDVVVPPIDTIGKTSIEVDVLAVAQNPSGPLSDLAVSVPAWAAGVAQVQAGGSVLVTLGDHAQTVPYLLTNTRPEAQGLSSYAFITVPALGFFPPTARPKAPALRVASGERLEISLDEQVQVAPGRTAQIEDPLAVTATKSDGSSLVVDGTTLAFTSAAGYAGPASITVPVTDRTSSTDTTARTSVITLPITVYAVDDYPPTFDPSVIDVAPGENPIAVDLRAFTTGPEGTSEAAAAYSYRITSAVPTGFTATLDGTTLRVAAATETARGTRASLQLALGYGRAGTMAVQVDLRAIASTRQLARLVDRTVPDGVQGRDSVVDVLSGAFNPYPDQALRVVAATVETPAAGTASVSGSSVAVRPAADFVGAMTVRVRVRDATGDPSREVESRIVVTVRGKPATPTAPRVGEVRDKTVVLSWDAPDNRGEPITGYRVTASPGNVVRQCTSTTCTIDALTNDTEYTFTVAARNAVDWSDPSPASAPARPDAVPDPPGAPTLAFGDGQVTATWSAPANGGSPITSYTVELSPAPPSGSATQSVPGTSATFRGLSNGTAYSVRVRAVNRAPQPSAWSPSSQAMAPAGVPAAPAVEAQRVATDLGGQINVSWAAPDGNGDAVRRYELVISGGAGAGTYPLDASRTSYALTGADNGAGYTFAVRAENKAGWSAPGTASGSTFGVPGSPTITSAAGSTTAAAGAGTVTLGWTAAGDNGSPVTRYEVSSAGLATATTSALTTTFDGLTGGQAYGFTVRACNAAGCGAPSAASSATPVTVAAPPGAVTLTATPATGRPTSAAVTWTAPGATGGSSITGYRYWVTVGATTLVDGADVGAGTTRADIALGTSIAPTGTTVTVRVVALTMAGASAEASVAAPLAWGAAPGTVDVTGLTSTVTGASVLLSATWAAATDSGVPVDRYEVRWRVGESWTDWETLAGGTRAATHTFDAVAAGTYTVAVEVRAHNAIDYGAAGSRTQDGVVVPPPAVPPGPGG